MSLTERHKGARGEREVVRLLHEHGWTNARRTSNGRAQAERGDIENGPAGVHIEVKFQERLNICKALDQATIDAGYLVPVVVHRPSRHGWMATLPLNEFLAMLAREEP